MHQVQEMPRVQAMFQAKGMPQFLETMLGQVMH
jgi:hypothetical protein